MTYTLFNSFTRSAFCKRGPNVVFTSISNMLRRLQLPFSFRWGMARPRSVAHSSRIPFRRNVIVKPTRLESRSDMLTTRSLSLSNFTSILMQWARLHLPGHLRQQRQLRGLLLQQVIKHHSKLAKFTQLKAFTILIGRTQRSMCVLLVRGKCFVTTCICKVKSTSLVGADSDHTMDVTGVEGYPSIS